MSQIRRIIAGALCVLAAAAMPVCAWQTGQSYAYDTRGRSVYAPVAYEAAQAVYGADTGAGAFSDPADLYVGGDGQIYIADTGNDRIVVLDEELKAVRIIERVDTADGETTLRTPKGVFAAPDGLLYICDTGHSRVIAVDEHDRVVRRMTADGIDALNENIAFSPEKLAVDSDRNVYVVSSSVYQGILEYDADDRFFGFFAPNEVPVTADVLLSAFWKRLFSSTQRDALSKTLPSPYNNLTIDAEGFLYTTAENVDPSLVIKRLNSVGTNILQAPNGGARTYGDRETSYENGREVTSRFIDVCVDAEGVICGLDAARCKAFLYDGEGELLCIFGGRGSSMGQFLGVSAVDKRGDDYLILDPRKNCLTVFRPTRYMQDVREALRYYREGLYMESIRSWEVVLRQNANFVLAWRSIGRACLQEGDVQKAMTLLERGDDEYFYSLAFQEARRAFVRRSAVWVLPALVLLCIAAAIIRRHHKKRRRSHG